MRLSVRVVCAVLALACVAAFVTVSPATAQVAGQNVNMVSGTKWPNGDPFLQRQNEPSMAVSTRNPLHILAGANDYRSVDLEQVLTGGAETGDAWLGLFKSFDGGYTWQSTLLPGCPYAVGQCKDSGALSLGNYQAAADPVVRAGTNGMFYFAGLAFDRPTTPGSASSVSTIFVARYNDLNNNEQLDPITYIDTHIVASGSSSQFLDKPSMAVDIPRAGAATCSFTANEPGLGANGGSLAVKQSFAAGNIYLAYTDFLSGGKANSTPTHLMFTHSTDCGVTWSKPVQINAGTTTSQGSTIAVNPVTGAVYVAWRQFGMPASSGTPAVPDAIMIAQSTNAGKSFSAPVQISKFTPFDQGTSGTTFRTNAYPALTSDMFGFVYVAFSARGVSSSGDARIVAAGSLDGTHWTPAFMVDNPSQNAQTNPSGRGHQIMPAMTFANGRLTLLYYDLRLDHYAGFYTPNPASLGSYTEMIEPQGELAPTVTTAGLNEVFTPYIDDAGLGLRRHTLDLRVLELGIFPTVVLGPSVLVSQYEFGCCVNPETQDIEQFKFNVPNLPLFDSGQEAFLGDYIDIVPSPAFVPSGNSWAYNFMPSVNPLFHATWTDNRDVVPPPPGGSWENYTAPVVAGAISVETGKPITTMCKSGQEGMRNQNIYTAQITGGLVAAAPGNAKPLGTTTFNGKTVPFQRAFPVEAQNTTAQPLNVRFTIANQPTGGTASFLQFSLLTTLDITIPPYSSVSRSVFATSTSATATITVNVAQISAIGGSVVNNGLSSTAVLNPDITNPNITNPNITNPNITNQEVTNPNITNPNITNPNITNPNITNPNITNSSFLNPNITNPNITNLDVTNVSATNPNITNPNITNPNITNPNITNPNITNPNITNPDITNGSIQDVTYPITNNGNTTASYTVKTASNVTVPGGIVLQLLINKLYQTPVAVNCQLGVQTHWVTVANIASPKLFMVADPNITNPDITNSTPNEATVTLAPGETAYITLRVVNPSPTTISFNPLTAITPVTVPQAVNTTTVLANPGNPNLTAPPVYPPVTVLTGALPATDRNDIGYSVQLQASGGKPGATTWTVSSGALPTGITLSPSGLVSGTATSPGSFPVTIKVVDTATPQDVGTQNFTLNVSPTPLTQQFVLTPQDGIVGQPYTTAPLAVNGGTTPYTWTATGLPPGLAINPSTGVISGTPTAAVPGGTTVTITATDAATPLESIQYSPTIRVGSVIAITPLTLPAGTIGTPYSVQLSASGGIPGYGFGPPVPAAGVTLSASGILSIANPQASTLSFSVTVHDAANPFQVQTANYTINFAGPVGGNVTFTTQPPNYAGGVPSPNSPVLVHVADNTNAPIPGANVTMSLNGTPPCSAAVLSGTLTQQTSATGDAFFTDLSVDRGQIGYALKATVASVFGVSNPFTVNGFCSTGNLSVARDFLTATLLQNGQVLVAGGRVTGTTASNAADLYDPTTGVSTGTTGMNLGRYLHTATLLNDGTVLIVGGEINATYLSSAEIYNPGNQTFTTLANGLNTARAGHTATLLADGTVLIAGGTNGDPLPSAEIYNPVTQTFTNVGLLNTARLEHAAALLPNGKVLIVSGLNATAELYDPVAKTFSNTGNLNTARQYASATLLPNGKVLVAGGLAGGVAGIGTAELYDPAAGTFSFTGGLNNPRGQHTANLLADGTVLVAGGYNCPPPSCTNPIQGTAEIYNPSNASFTITGSLINARYDHAATVLNDGTVLIAGGFSGNSPTASDERHYSTAPLAAMQVTTPTTLATGQPATTAFTNPTAFNGAATGITPIGFNGILPAGVPFEGANPLIVSGYNFSTTNPATTVNLTTSTFYTPNNYPADFLIDSSNPGPNNEVTIILPAPTRALGIDYGGFAGGATGSISLSNGFVLPLSALPAAGQTQFSGFVSATPFSSLTFNINNDSWVVLDLLQATANTALTSATEGVPYTQVLLEQGGVGSMTWTLASGSLPPGMNLSSAGVISGTPTVSGTYTFTVHLVDSSPTPKAATSGSLKLAVIPQPPTNVAQGPVSPGSIGVIWEFSLSGDATGYNVYRSTTSGGPYTQVGSLPASAFSFTDTSVASGTTYYYVVRAAAGSVESVNSNEVAIQAP